MIALEEEEEKIIQLEDDKAAMHEETSDEEDISMMDLSASVKKVRGKINIIKQRSMLKSKRRAKSKIKDLTEMTEQLQKQGIDVNTESLATRVRNPRRISELEANQDKKAKLALDISDDSDDDQDVEVDEAL